MKYIIPLLLVMSVLGLQAQAVKYPAVTIPGTHTRYITSSVVAGQEYELQILLPAAYETSTKKYPLQLLKSSSVALGTLGSNKKRALSLSVIHKTLNAI